VDIEVAEEVAGPVAGIEVAGPVAGIEVAGLVAGIEAAEEVQLVVEEVQLVVKDLKAVQPVVNLVAAGQAPGPQHGEWNPTESRNRKG